MMQAKLKALFLALLLLPALSQAHTVTLEIDRNLGWRVDFPHNGASGTVISAQLIDQGQVHSLLTYEGWRVSKHATKLVIALKDSPRTLLKLPDPVEQRLLQFFKEKPNRRTCTANSFEPFPDIVFDCTAFVHYVHNIDIEKLSRPIGKDRFRFDQPALFKYWQLNDFDKNFLLPGDVIALDGPHGNHFALYLGENLYISKFGDGSVWVSTLSAFRHAYEFTHITTFKAIERTSSHEMFAKLARPLACAAGIGLVCALVTYLN